MRGAWVLTGLLLLACGGKSTSTDTGGGGATAGTGSAPGGSGGNSGSGGSNLGGSGGCSGGLTDCGGICVNTHDDPSHCGACGSGCTLE